MRRRMWKAVVPLAGASCAIMLGVLPLRAGTINTQENEEDGVTVPQGHKEAYEAAKEQMKEAPKETKKSWTPYIAGAMGVGFPQSDRGSVVTPAGETPLSVNYNYSYIGAIIGGLYFHDPDKWGNLSFTVDAIGLFLGSQQQSSLGPGAASPGHASMTSNSAVVGYLGLGGTVGYRIAKKFEPFVGFAGGGILVNAESSGVNMGSVWGYWFAPEGGVRYFIDSHWFLAAVFGFAFDGDVNGFHSGTTVLNVSGPSYGLYDPFGLFVVGYGF
ncbi:hypothetical protein [Methylacidimicrobium tartarophylax]|uniref:Outer membrane protein beta-barrel domain-containing protein n=1 Tax=Methylacidimicrobium tartarophylax TaxID=1041768 RepID=A0A5E6MMF1_9BACT|nr:hypothetical protein [Methylacidimicrobium tartarophylax]VVM06604.1 hypothetical protein MAMT_01311 [Methylacidimicrobium tartarophylax]